MGLVLKIENETSLPDGGPLSVSVQGKRGIDIGRDRHLDWTLPDPSRAISGKHCEIRYQDGGYVLFDVSTNGTYLDGKDGRLKGPHRLKNGDRLIIGHYIIGVTVDGTPGDTGAPATREVQPTAYGDLWNDSGDAAPPVDRKNLQAPRERARPQHADFLDWAADVPDAAPPSPAPRPAAAPPQPPSADDFSWASGPARPAPIPEPPPQVPEPRRPIRASSEPDPVWTQTADPSQPAPAAPPPSVRADDPFPPAPSAAGDFRSRIARAAGISEDKLAQKSPQELADELGLLMQLITEQVRQLLKARLQAKGIARSTQQTTVQAVDNNPLKFAATTKDALEVMLGPQTKSYLDARRAFEQGFNDLKSHQLQTFTAMQQALAMLVDDLDPQSIDKSIEPDSAIAKLVTSRKAKLWDAYVSRWQSKTRRFDGGLLDAFMEYFAQCYDRNNPL